METKTIQQITQELSEPSKPKRELPNLGFDTKTETGLQVVRPVKYETPITSVYDRLSNGTYIAKFENYQGATGNEERLARQQSASEKIGHGLQKFAAKSVGYAVDSIIGTAYGLGAAITQGDLSKIYDNDFANAMDDWNKTLDNKIPNYYTEEEKSKDILSSLGTVNFWANDFLGGLAFVTGAVLPTVAIGALTGGATAAGTLGAAGLKSGLKKGLKEGVEETLEAGAKRSILGKVSDVTGYTQGRALTKGYFQQKLGSKLGSVVDTGAFIARTASFEAGMEARQNYKESVEDFYNSYNDTHGHLPSYDEAKSFLSDARSASNSVYGANMALLTASNAVMFGKKIVPDAVTNYFGKVSGFAEKAIGLGKKAEMVEGKLVYKALTATKAQKLLGNVYKIGKKPITEGIYEEGLQGVAGKTMQNYLEAKYDPTNTQAYSSWSAFHDALTEQYSSKDGWKEMGIGMIIGLVGGGVSPQAIKAGTAFGGFGNDSRLAASKQVEEDVAKLNKGIETFANMNRTSAVQAMAAAKKRGKEDINTKAFEDTLEHKAFIQSQLGINTPSEMRRDHDKIIDAQIIDDTHNIEIHSALQDANVTVEQYKTALKNDFKTNLDAFEKGKKRADNLELGRRLKGESAGNIAEIHDAIITHSMLGEGALSAAEKASQQLDAIIGETGIFSSEKFYNGLSEEKKQKIAQLKANETKLTKLKADAIKYGQALSGIPVKGVNETEIGKLDAKRKALSQKAVVTQSMITDLEQEKGRLEEAIGSDFTVSDYDVEIPGEGVKNTSIVSSMEQLDKVEKLIKSLRLAGKNHEANTIQYLQTTVRAHLDAHRETVQAYRGMLETDFFSKKEGKHFLSKVLGKKYETSQEFKDIVKENNEYIDRSLNLAGIRGYETVEGKINAAIAENPQLSDREKYRMESLIRMQATRTAAEHIAQTLSETYTQVAPERVSTKKYTIAGDSVQLTKAVDLTNLTNVEALETAIKDITEQLDYVVNRETKNADEIANLNNQITKLKQQRNAIKEKQQQEKISREQGGINEREGISEGELNEEPIQETSDETDNRDSIIPSETQAEEIIPVEGELMPEPTIVVAPTLEETLANRLNTIEDKIASAEQNLDNLNKETFRIITSEDYIKYTALLDKQNTKGGLNKSEQIELASLQQDLDQWTYITGSVVDGFRLSELMQQKSTLENTPIEDVVDLVVPVTQDTLAIVDIQDAETKANYSFTQSYHKVLAGRDGNVVTLYHINEVALNDEISEVVDIDGNKIVRYNAQGDPLFNRDERNNIIFTEEEIAAINEQSNLSILSTNEKFDTKYPVVLKKSLNPNGETTVKPLETSFSQEFNNGQGHSIADIYAAEKGNKLTVSFNLNDQHNRRLLATYKNSIKDVKAKKALQEAKNILKKGLLFTVKDSKGNVVGTLKGINNSVKNETTDISFEAMRNAIVDNEEQFKGILAGGIKGEISVQIQDTNGNFIEPNITVKEVLLGQPNYNYTVPNTDGTPNVEFRQPTKEQAKKVVAIGYVQEGKTFTNDHKTVNTIFLRKLSQTNKTTKIPFIVLEVGAQRFAYPVKVAVQEGAGLEEFEAIYNADTLAIDKVIALNKFMASKGIDIKVSGNAFVTFGDTNLTDAFFNEKLAQLKAINYFYNVEEWINPETDMQQIVENQISVDIDLVNPLHSPKLSMDLSKLRVKGIEYDDSQEEGEEITAELVEVPLTIDEVLACKKVK